MHQEQDDGRAWDAAAAISELLEDPSAWRYRRSERFELRSAEAARRFVSIDFEVPEAQRDRLRVRAPRAGEAGQWLVPLGWLRRGPLVGFDLRQDGASLPLLLASEIEAITRRLLELELALALAGVAADERETIEATVLELIDDVVAFVVPADAAGRIDALRSASPALEGLTTLLDTSREGYLALTLLPSVHRRQVVKLAYDEPLPADVDGLLFETPGVLEAASTHVEAPLPLELRAHDWDLIEASAASRVLQAGGRHADRPAVYVTSRAVADRLRAMPDAGPVGLRLRVRVERWRFHHPAWVLAALVAGFLVVCGTAADLRALRTANEHGPVVTVLLAGVALFVALLLRLDEHSLARRLLRVPRALLAGALGSAVVASAALALGGDALLDVWRAAAVVATGAAVGLVTETVWEAAGPSGSQGP